MRIWAASIVAVAALGETVPSATWLPVYVELARQVKAESDGLTNFTCLQATRRERSTAGKAPRRTLDFVRLEAGVVNGREVYGWPGEELSSDSPDMQSLTGTSASGAMYGHTRSIVAERVVRIRHVEAERGEWIFSFVRDALGSDLKIVGNGQTTFAGYEGSFAVDSAAKRLRWLRLAARDISIATGIRSTETTLRFSQTAEPPLSLLPEAARTVVEFWSGERSILLSTWSNCSQYQVESAVRFEAETAPAAAGPPAVKSRWTRPAEGEFETVLAAAFPLDRAGVGDLVPFRLAKALRLRGGGELPAGTAISARLVALTPDYVPGRRLLGLVLEAVVTDRVRVAFASNSLRLEGPQLTRVREQPRTLGSLAGTTEFEVREWESPLSGVPGVALFTIPMEARQLIRPLTVVWRQEPR